MEIETVRIREAENRQRVTMSTLFDRPAKMRNTSNVGELPNDQQQTSHRQVTYYHV